ncbi:MAG: radical SAM protein, partial [Burkholderiaceae bacterium]
TWPAFCRDVEAGAPRPLYRETGSVDLADSPTPRFELLRLERYNTASLQFSRGCPYRCDFCDVIVMFGRRPRVKSLEQIGRELDALRAQRVRQVFFVDDNLIGHRAHAKALLRFLADYQCRHRWRFGFGTEASINLAGDDELLQLMRAAHFGWVFVGIETPDEATLRASGKMQNTRTDLLAALRRIYAHGIDVLGGFIVGFDADTAETFERQRRFVMASGIQAAMIGLLTALPRTPLYERLQREGRLLDGADDGDNTRLGTNFSPRLMSPAALVAGYRQLYRELLTDRGIAERIRTKLAWLRAPVYRGEHTLGERLRIVTRLLVKGIAPGGPRRWAAFASTLTLAPRRWPLVVSDWITGLSMHAYVQRRFADAAAAVAAIEKRARRLRRALARELASGAVRLAQMQGRIELALARGGELDARFFRRVAPRLERLLRCTPATLTLRIDALPLRQVVAFERLLARIARHGDRVSVVIHETLRELIHVDSSVFDLVLGERGMQRGGA